MKIRKGDMVKIIAGKEKGKTGRVLRVDMPKARVWIEKLNFVKRHQRPSQQYRQGGIIEKEAPVHVSNVMIFDEKSNKTSRVGYKRLDDGRKVRIAKATGDVIEIKA